MYLIYNEQGKIDAVEGKAAEPGFFTLDDIEVGPNYVGQLNTILDKTHPSVLGPEWVVLIKLFITFLLSEDGQYFLKKAFDWIYRLWLNQRVNKFVKRYRDDLVKLTGEKNLDKLKNILYSHTLTLIQYQLKSDDKIKLYQAFQKG